MRKKIVAGNWKMNLNSEAANLLLQELITYSKNGGLETANQIVKILFPPYLYIQSLSALAATSGISIGAQNCSDKEFGAFTGEVSASMIASCGAKYCLVGHSERRSYFGETDHTLALKVEQCLKNNLIPIFCIGETLNERNSNKHFAIIEHQINHGLFHLAEQQFKNVVIAYEPVWAIGTGVTASADQAQEMHAFIRTIILKKYGPSAASATSILYGGSCNSKNAKELFSCPDIDGGLIGGASLKAEDFISIIKSF